MAFRRRGEIAVLDQRSLHDLMALIRCRNITEAARRRHVSQPAFSRRLQSLEAALAVTLVDRSTRPACPSAVLDAARGEIETALEALARAERRLRRSDVEENEMVVAATHSLASGLLADALAALARGEPGTARTHVRIVSANVHECYRMLMTGEVPLLLCYQSASQRLQVPHDLVDKTAIVDDMLLPVCRAAEEAQFAGSTPGQTRLPLVAYPREVFLGKVLEEEILPRCAHEFRQSLVTDFTSATLASVRAGAGMAWLPRTLIGDLLANGELVALDGEHFPRAALQVAMFRVRRADTHDVSALREVAGRIADAVRESTAHARSAVDEDMPVHVAARFP